MRSENAVIRLITILVFAAMLLYIIFALLSSALNPLKTEAVSATVIEDSVDISGYIVRDETVLSGDADHIITVSSGDKVSVDQTIAVKYDDEAAIERIAKMQELSNTLSQLETNIAGKNSYQEVAVESVISFSEAISSGNMADIDSAVSGIETHIMNAYGNYDQQEQTLADFKSQLAELESSSASDASYMKSTYSGIFALTSDGYENISFSDLENITPSALAALFTGKEAGPNAIGKIVTGLTWKYAVILDNAVAERLSEGSSYEIVFESSFGKSLKMTVDSIGPTENDKCVVIFSSNKYISDTVTLREAEGKILFNTTTGLCIPKDAVYYDDDGTPYVYILVGLQARRADIEIISELEDCYIADPSSSSLLRIGSEVIVKAKDLYDGKVVQ